MGKRLGRLVFAAAIVGIYLMTREIRQSPVNVMPAPAVKGQPHILMTSPAADDIIGFNGPTPAGIKLDPETGRIAEIEFLPNAEDPSFWGRVLRSGVFDKYIGKTPEEATSLEIDAVSGATFSAVAAQETIRRRLGMAAGSPSDMAPAQLSLRWSDVLAGGVLLLNLLAVFGRQTPRRRIFMNLVNVAALGFISFAFLSTAQILNWIGSAPHWRLSPPLLLFWVVLPVAVVFGWNIYCARLCPYGCAQDLIFAAGRKCRIPPFRLNFSYGPYIRRVTLAVCVLALLCGLRFIPLEPFSAFTLDAPWYIVLLALFFLAAAMFQPRLWCRWFCPCGALMDFFKKSEPERKLPKGGKLMSFERVLILILLVAVVIAISRPQVQLGGMGARGEKDVLSVIHQRKSVRNYTGEHVTAGQLETLVKAGFAAPTARNCQPWEFIVVTERETLNRLGEKLHLGKMLLNAPAAIAVCGNSSEFLEGEDRDTWIQDCSAAAQNILLAAEGLDLGAVWVGVYPAKQRMEHVAEVLKLPDVIIPLCIISIGYPTGLENPRDKYRPTKVRFQSWK